jgi:ferrous iron transport protein A
MANSAHIDLLLDHGTDESSPARPGLLHKTLEAASPGKVVRVVALRLEEDLRAWIAAVGIGVGERLTILRRGAFGGPIHVRTAAGGEFALEVSLARSILVA